MIDIIFSRLLLIGSLFILSDNIANSARILGVFNHPAKSHTSLGKVIFEELARRGHDVVFLNGYDESEKRPKFKNVVIEGIVEDLIRRENMYFDRKPLDLIEETFQMTVAHIEATFANSELQAMIARKETFDLVVSDYLYTDANLVLAHIFQAPMVFLSSYGNALPQFTGNELPSSYVPGCGLKITDKMSFTGRLVNTLANLFAAWLTTKLTGRHTALVRKHFPDAPTVDEMYDNIALVLANSHFSTETPRSATSNVIYIGGFHIQPPQPLNHSVQSMIDQSKCSIYFSLGSQIKSENLGNETLQSIVAALSKVKCTVLWKLENNRDTQLPSNVVIQKWFKQADILAHPKVKLFISHGGLLSMTESIHYGVPMVVIPLNGDQNTNAKFVESREIGKMTTFKEFNEEIVTEVLHNPKYKQRITMYSELLRNQPIKPLDNAIFWLEHVIAHKGGAHLRPYSLKLPWYQRYLIDVYLVIITVVCTFLFVIYCSVRLLISAIRKVRKVKIN